MKQIQTTIGDFRSSAGILIRLTQAGIDSGDIDTLFKCAALSKALKEHLGSEAVHQIAFDKLAKQHGGKFNEETRKYDFPDKDAENAFDKDYDELKVKPLTIACAPVTKENIKAIQKALPEGARITGAELVAIEYACPEIFQSLESDSPLPAPPSLPK